MFAARMASPPKGPKRIYPPTAKEMTQRIGDMTNPTQLQPLLRKYPLRVGHIQLTAAVAQAAWLLKEGDSCCLLQDTHTCWQACMSHCFMDVVGIDVIPAGLGVEGSEE